MLLHGFFLISLNLFSVMAAVVILHFAKANSGELLQSVVALVVNFGVYSLVFRIMHGIQKDVMHIRDFSMLAIILISSLALFPAVFYPIHFMVKGHWSSFDNIMAIWSFQVFVNGICLVANYFIFGRIKRKEI